MPAAALAIYDRHQRAGMAALNDTLIHQLALPAAASLGFPVLSSRFGRAYIDLNRSVTDLDPHIIASVPAHPAPSARVAAGLGLIPRLRGGQGLPQKKLSLAAVQSRIDRVYRPYHERLQALVQGCQDRFGTCILIDLHSMPPCRLPQRGVFWRKP